MDEEGADTCVGLLLLAVSVGSITLIWKTLDSVFAIAVLTLLNLVPLGGAIRTFGHGVPGLSRRDVLQGYAVVAVMTLVGIVTWRWLL